MVPERPEASLKSRIPVSYGDPVLGLTHAALRTQGFWLDGGAMPWAITLLGCSDERGIALADGYSEEPWYHSLAI